MKVCSRCKESKSLSSFNKRGARKDGTIRYQSNCKPCNKEYQKEHYQNNKTLYKKKAKDWKKIYKSEAYKVLRDVARGGCSYCNEKDFRCLQFNHIKRDTKINSISKMISDCVSLDIIKSELEKCEVVCANCHAKITSEQFDWYKE